MSMHDNGYGRTAGPAPVLQSGFANKQGVGTAPGHAWSGSALDTRKSEVNSMAQGPGRPLMGQQQPMFGGGSSVFAPMPTYTPVTRGPDQAPTAPEPAPSFNPYPQNQPQQPAPSFARPQPAPQGGNYALPDYEPAYRSPNFSHSRPRTTMAGRLASRAPRTTSRRAFPTRASASPPSSRTSRSQARPTSAAAGTRATASRALRLRISRTRISAMRASPSPPSMPAISPAPRRLRISTRVSAAMPGTAIPRHSRKPMRASRRSARR